MRNFIFTKAQLLSLRSLGSSFINFRIFPKLSFRTLQQPRRHGGLQVLDPIVQQQALQWRWICPLILATCHSPLLPTYTTPNIPLQYTLQWYFHSTAFSDYFYYLLFPTARQTIWFQHRPSPHQAFLNILTNVITTMDRIPRSFTTCHLDFHTGLSLPFLEIILHTLPSTHPHFSSFTAPDQLFDRHHAVQKLLAIDVFTFDFDLQVIRLRNWTFLEFCHYPRISHRVARWIEEGQIYLQPFFLALCRQAPRHSFTSASFGANPHNIRPLIRRLIKPITPLPPTVPLNSIQYYKHLVSTEMPTINTSPHLFSHPNGASFGNYLFSFNPELYGIDLSIEKFPPNRSSTTSSPQLTLHLRVLSVWPRARRISNISSLLVLSNSLYGGSLPLHTYPTHRSPTTSFSHSSTAFKLYP
ncbi:uncharacterized protein ATC70_004790 [Mucor velutinosus]|uniref:Uncharacterized protein n=1 Tax=Mucor velutinosus TaxID=708070 RepID=A0AAN7D9H3_9FUNG|nr:hypothetical protein ATC70_004790 [Mucor velutinosus]